MTNTLKLKDGRDISPIIDELEKARAVGPNGKVSFRGGTFATAFTGLESAISFSDALTDIERLRLTHQSVFEAAKRKLSTASVLSEAFRFQQLFLKKPLEAFVLVTGISSDLIARRRISRESRITFERRPPTRFDDSPVVRDVKNYVRLPLPLDYTWVCVTTRARSREEAHRSSMAAINLVRGIWNLFFNRRVGTRHSNQRPNPVNKIVLSPIQTLHSPDGKLVENTFWYDPEYLGPLPTLTIGAPTARELRKFEHTVRRRVRRSPDRRWLEDRIVEYCCALDEWNLEVALLKLWSLLEALTGTLKVSYAVTINRTANLFKNPPFHRLVLESFREQRNRLVHAGAAPTRLEDAVYGLKSYVESTLTMFIQNRLGFRSRSEMWEFLDLPSDAELLRKRAYFAKKALTLRGVN